MEKLKNLLIELAKKHGLYGEELEKIKEEIEMIQLKPKLEEEDSEEEK